MLTPAQALGHLYVLLLLLLLLLEMLLPLVVHTGMHHAAGS
jgi:hypothetical protein